MNAQAPETRRQDSRGQRLPRAGISGGDALGIALSVAAFAGAILLVVSDFMTLFRVQTEAGVTIPDGSVSGHENHSFAMLLVGVAALPLAYGAMRQGSRPAMTGLAGLGLIAIVIAVGFDLSDATGTNNLARTFEEATGSPSTGFYMETLGAVLLIASGGGWLVLTAPGREPRAPRPPGAPQTAEAEQRERDEAERAAAAAARAEARRRRQEE